MFKNAKITLSNMNPQNKRIEIVKGGGRDTAFKSDTGTFHDGLGLHHINDLSGLIVHDVHLYI